MQEKISKLKYITIATIYIYKSQMTRMAEWLKWPERPVAMTHTVTVNRPDEGPNWSLPQPLPPFGLAPDSSPVGGRAGQPTTYSSSPWPDLPLIGPPPQAGAGPANFPPAPSAGSAPNHTSNPDWDGASWPKTLKAPPCCQPGPNCPPLWWANRIPFLHKFVPWASSSK